MPITKEVKDAIEAKVNSLGFSLEELTYKRENGDNILRIVIDKDEEVNLDDIVEVSSACSDLLDELNPIEENYMLDVTSLGVEKPIKLEKLQNYVEKYVNIHLTNPYKGENILEGILKEVTDEIVKLSIRVKSKTKEIEISRKYIDKARTAVKF